MNLSPLPIQKFFDNNGKPLDGGFLFTYASGTTTKIATYKDQAGTLNTNPIVLDYRGEANVWLDPTLTYKFTLAPVGDTDPPTKPIWTVDNISAAVTYASLTQQILGQILFPRTAAEIAASVTPIAYQYPSLLVYAGDYLRQGVIADGVTDDSAAAARAELAGAKSELAIPLGSMLRDPSTVSVQQRIVGQGWTSDTSRLPTGYWKKRTNGTHVALTGDYSALYEITLDGDKAGGKTGDGVQVGATRQTLDHVSSLNQAGVGIRIGGAGATGVFNANIWDLHRCSVVSSTGDGIYENHTGGTVTGTYPLGIPDCNAGVAVGTEVRLAGGVGWKIENSIDNVHVGSVIQSCTGKGVVFKQYARGHKFFGLYSEANNGGGGARGDELDIESGATENIVIGLRSNQLAGAGARDVNTAGKNLLIHYDSGVGSWVYRAKFALWNPFEDGSTTSDFEAWCGTTPVNAGKIKWSIGGTSGGIMDVETKIDGGALTRRVRFAQNGDVTFTNQTNGTLFGGKTAFDTTTTGTTIEHGAGRIDIVNSGAGTKTAVAFYDASGAAGSITTSGAGATAYNLSSDARLKEHIGSVDSSVIDDITIRHYRRKFDGSEEDGVFAQELHTVYPGAVAVGGDDPHVNPWGVDYSKLVPLLIAEVQALRKRVTQLEGGK